MRISIPPGTEIFGQKSKYIIQNVICLSDRATTVLCKDSQNNRYRLKIYDGNSSINKTSFVFYNEVKTRGLLSLIDYGEVSGNPFFVYREYNAKSVDRQVISIDLLVNKVIPQISYVINQIHSKRYVIRDITVEHILFDPNYKEIMFTGVGNFVKLQGKTTATKEKGYGQNYSYIAPEVEQYGYSSASDYFSLGVVLLSIIRGRNVIQDISQKKFYEELNNGRVPGIDVNHLRNTSPKMYSVEDRVAYLILGLLLANPNQRWGYGEIKCWCNNQLIPLVRNGDKVYYQYSTPLVLGGAKCWNDKQIAHCLATKTELWNDKNWHIIKDYFNSQQSRWTAVLGEFSKDNNYKSQLFKTIYTLCPEMDGFVWEGRKYKSTQDLAETIKNGKLSIAEFQTILKYKCLSFFEYARAKIGYQNKIDIKEIQSLETTEQTSPGDGAYRGVLLFSSSKQDRYFEVDGKRYKSPTELLMSFKGKELHLKEISGNIIQSAPFQAWLWAKGYEKMGKEARKSLCVNSQNAFAILMTVLEKCSSDDNEKKTVRGFFLKYNDLAPIAWLFANINYYIDESKMNTALYERFKNVRLDLGKSVQELSQFLSKYVRDYQLFVQSTLNNPFVLEFGGDDSISYDFIPMYEAGFFCEKWNGMLEVCPAFLNSVNNDLNNQKIRKWLEECGNKQREILNNKTDCVDTKDISGANEYLYKCKKNIISSVIMMLLAVILMFVGFHFSVKFALLSFMLAAIFPILSATLYYKKRVRAEIWYRTYKQQADMVSSINSLIGQVRQREEDIYQRLIKHNNSKCIVKKANDAIDMVMLEDPEELNLSKGQIITAYLSTFGFVLLTTVLLGYLYTSFLSACLYAAIYGIGVPYLFRKQKFVNSCFEWTITTCIVCGIAMIGGMAFGKTFFVTMNWIPVVIAIGIVIIVIIISNI